MKKKLLGSTLIALSLLSSTAFGCTFSWQHYGNPQVFKRLESQIGRAVTDEYCNKYNSHYEIVVISDTYTNNQETLANVSIGFRKRGSNEVPVKRWSGYRSQKGNFVIAKAYDLAAAIATDNLMDVMSALDDYIPK